MTSIEHRNLLLQHWDHEYNCNKCPVHVSSQQSTRAVGTGRHGALPCGQPGSTPACRTISSTGGDPPRVTTAYLTGAKENYSFKVCILIAVYIQSRHTVTELLELPDVLHDLLYPVSRKFIYKSTQTSSEKGW